MGVLALWPIKHNFDRARRHGHWKRALRNWHLLNTKPNKERQVASALYLRGIEVYLPLVWVNPVNPRSARQRPYFAGSLFAELDPYQAASSALRWMVGLKGMVEYDGAPAVVPDALLDELRDRLGRIQAVSGMTFEPASNRAASLLTHGPFLGYEAVFNSGLSGADRARVLAACIQHHCALESQHVTGRGWGRETGSGK